MVLRTSWWHSKSRICGTYLVSFFARMNLCTTFVWTDDTKSWKGTWQVASPLKETRSWKFPGVVFCFCPVSHVRRAQQNSRPPRRLNNNNTWMPDEGNFCPKRRSMGEWQIQNLPLREIRSCFYAFLGATRIWNESVRFPHARQLPDSQHLTRRSALMDLAHQLWFGGLCCHHPSLAALCPSSVALVNCETINRQTDVICVTVSRTTLLEYKPTENFFSYFGASPVFSFCGGNSKSKLRIYLQYFWHCSPVLGQFCGCRHKIWSLSVCTQSFAWQRIVNFFSFARWQFPVCFAAF